MRYSVVMGKCICMKHWSRSTRLSWAETFCLCVEPHSHKALLIHLHALHVMEIEPYQTKIFWTGPNPKHFADDKLHVAKIMISVYDRVANII